ncbi:MAG TPA: hypothetical protein VIJ94_14350 [Caulobacteraceae bacterium]
MSTPRAAAAACFMSLALPLTASAAAIHIYSYDPVSPAARALTSTGLSFEFVRGLLGGVRVERIVQTGDRGSAGLKPASEADLGGGGLRAALAKTEPVGPLYEILPNDAGESFVHAVCPGADRAWLLIGRLERFKTLELQAVGRRTGEAGAHACASLEFSFHSEWRTPDQEVPTAQLFGARGPG